MRVQGLAFARHDGDVRGHLVAFFMFVGCRRRWISGHGGLREQCAHRGLEESIAFEVLQPGRAVDQGASSGVLDAKKPDMPWRNGTVRIESAEPDALSVPYWPAETRRHGAAGLRRGPWQPGRHAAVDPRGRGVAGVPVGQCKDTEPIETIASIIRGAADAAAPHVMRAAACIACLLGSARQ